MSNLFFQPGAELLQDFEWPLIFQSELFCPINRFLYPEAFHGTNEHSFRSC